VEIKKEEREKLEKGGAKLWRSKCERQELWRFSKNRKKKGERKGRKDVSKSGMTNGVQDWIGSQVSKENCLKWNGISSLLKIGGRMSRYEVGPIFINEKMMKKAV